MRISRARVLFATAAACCVLMLFRAERDISLHQRHLHPLRSLIVIEDASEMHVAGTPQRALHAAQAASPLDSPASSPAAVRRVACDLLFAIPTVHREHAVDYLNLTLEALLCELPDPKSLSSSSPAICVAVYEARHLPRGSSAGVRTSFDKARSILAGMRPDIIFLSAPSTFNNSLLSAAERAGSASGPGKAAATKRQTADVARMLLAVAPLSRAHVVLMEDDWLLCQGAMDAIRYLRTKASIYQREWAALRFSYGLNGIMMHTKDLGAMATFLLDPSSDPDNDLPDAPVDHLVYRWLRGKYSGGRNYFGRRHIMAFRHTLFWHIGDSSAVGNSAARHRPKCYGLTKEWLFDKEAFHVDDCPDDDLWPCTGRPTSESEGADELRRLSERTVTTAAGASQCGASRLCWHRPTLRGGPMETQCAAHLLCPKENTGLGETSEAPCITSPPEYSDGDRIVTKTGHS